MAKNRRPNIPLKAGPAKSRPTVTTEALSSRDAQRYLEAKALSEGDAPREALPLLEALVERYPASRNPRQLLATTLYNTGSWHEALAQFNELATRFPQRSDAASNLAGVLSALGHQELAFQAIDRALALDPHNTSAITNLAEILKNLGNWEGARDTYAASLAIDANNPKLHLQYGMTLIALGDWKTGWPETEHREAVEGVRLYPEPVASPRWRGTGDLNGKRLLISHEQGLGDAIMNVRFAKRLAAQGAEVHLRAPSALVPLLEAVDGVTSCTATGSPMPEHDVHVPLMSLPAVLGIEAEGLDGLPYLSPPGTCPAHLMDLLPNDRILTVSLTWSGNPNHTNNRRRSMNGDVLAPMLDIPGVRFVALQKFPPIDAVLPEALRSRVVDLGAQCSNFAESAHALQRVDLAITVDTAVAHLAGALGVATLVCLPFASEYRWGTRGSTTAWYRSHTLLRQPAAYDWASVISAAIGEVERRRDMKLRT